MTIAKSDFVAFDDCFEQIRPRLVQRAALRMLRERRDHTLQATALVHEVYLRMRRQEPSGEAGGEGLERLALLMMERILRDHARGRSRLRRGGNLGREPLVPEHAVAPAPHLDGLAIDELLERLRRIRSRASRVVRLHHYGGLTVKETARLLGICERQAARELKFALWWLGTHLQPDGAASPRA